MCLWLFTPCQPALRVCVRALTAGFSLYHSDVGGYTMIKDDLFTYLRSQELLLRWMEMSAFSDCLFRTHPGTYPGDSAQFYSNNDTFAAFARCASLHRYGLCLPPHPKPVPTLHNNLELA